jgi:Rho GDP-dissociation inhibitor
LPPHTHTSTFIDQNDESLRKWKESLGLGSGNTISDPNDPRKVILLSLGLEVEGRSDIIIDLTQTGALESLNKKPFTIKEGATFRMKARFRVQHDILSGMKYVQVVSRMGIKQKMQEMIVCSRIPEIRRGHEFALTLLQGSYSPNTTDKPEYEKKCTLSSFLQCASHVLTNLLPVEPESAPTGMLGRGHYEASSMFTDDDKNVYLKFAWSFDIKKDW